MRALLYVWSAYLFVTASWAWSPFSDQPDLQETRLSAQDLTRIQINAGWAKGDDRTLLFEVQNSLKGPSQCSGVQVDLKDGKSLSKNLMPKLFVPPSNARQASLPGVQKGTMKAYAVNCTCFKSSPNGDCVNPLRKN